MQNNIVDVPKDFHVSSGPFTCARAKQLQKDMQGLIKKLCIQEAKDGDGVDFEFKEEVGFN